jgi:hypothetical protein
MVCSCCAGCGRYFSQSASRHVAGAGLIAGGSAGHATTALGVALVVYAVVGLAKVRMLVPSRIEPWFSPLIGWGGLGLEKKDLVQALGLSFTASTIALAAVLASYGAFHTTPAGASVLCMAPAFVGMFLGQWIRLRVDPATFRLLFFIGRLLLGGDLIAQSVT